MVAGEAEAHDLAMIRRVAILSLATPVMRARRARDWADSSAYARVQRAIEQNDVWVAEIEESVIGWIEIARDRVEGLYVRPDQAGCGVGSTLLSHAEAQIRSAGHPAVRLDASWNADRFYLRRGYQPQAERLANEGRPMSKLLHD